MKKKVLSLFLLCIFTSNLCYGNNRYEKDRENWLPRLKEIYGDEQPSVKKDDTIDNARELKYPGQRFTHIGIVELGGKGKLIKKYKYWFPTEKYVNLEHRSSFIILEEIVSNENELDEGIIKSHFVVQSFNEQLVEADGGMKIGFIDTKDIINTVKTVKETYGSVFDRVADNFIKTGIATATAAALAPEPVITKGVALAALSALGIGLAIKSGSFVIDKALDKTDDDGNIILSRERIEKLCPDADMMIQKLHRLEGTKIYATWIAQNGERDPNKIGYTQLDIETPQDSDVTEDDKEMLCKMIYRANPFGVKSILPDDKKGLGNRWDIDASDVMSWLNTAGIKYDTVQGIIHVLDAGSSQSNRYEDENALQKKKEITVTTLRAVTKNNDRLRFMKKMEDSSQVKMSVIPTSGAIVVVEPNEEAPKYVKEVNVEGRIESHIDKPTGLLANIVYEENSVNIKYSYVQERLPIKAGNKINSNNQGK